MRLTRSPPDYNWATFGTFLLRLCQQVIVEDVLITYQAGESKPEDSCTRAPRREHHLNKLAVDAGVERRRGEEEIERTYSDAPPSPPPRRRRLDTNS